jgi:ubiquinone/menaquinone biosynthesis C-methylase UbiE
MLARILEPEIMDSEQEVIDYDSMDHVEVNRRFVADLIASGADLSDVLDLGTGTAQIPIELCRTVENARLTGADAAANMLRVGKANVAEADLPDRIELQLLDAKQLPYVAGRFSTVMSNSIVHHIPNPLAVLEEAVRVCAPDGTLFFRDLMRPDDVASLDYLVATYAADANEHQRQMFRDSLHAALTLDEIRGLISSLGFPQETVVATSDRHWTWTARRQA